MEQFQEPINRLAGKLQLLIRKYQALQRENEKLKNELRERNEKIGSLQETAERFQEQLGLLKASAGSLDHESKQALEKRIDGYIREIDKCISQLEKS